ncbi:Amino acid permease [Geosmithia morbida]|uniref:Amino acid permease n=1 Tax=Geosmithia morbida TaxID=1094350 RepID=A0A9P4YNR2_9HYPO|nr:Amino acid permease [Geosmithia morbida]KAF4120338.1 Amino acid permease [Geosmithia morbida]
MGVQGDVEAKNGAVSTSDTGNGVLIDADDIANQYGQTHRGLSPRHVQLMAIGGSIGTGLFVGIGSTLSEAGPLSLLLGYLLWGVLFIWPCNLCVAELCSYLPVRGSIFELAGRFVDPAMGFTLGWTYFYAGTMLVCVEYSAVATVMEYWLPDVNAAAWIVMSMVVCILLNVVAVKFYGEAEFIMASLKILLLFGLVLITLVTMCGGNPKDDAYGFRYWKDGKAMLEYYTTGATGRFCGVASVIFYAGFTIAGPDMIAVAAGEIQNPRRTIPRVAKLIFWRLVGFYVVGVFAVGIICSSSDPRLLGAIEDGSAGSAASPWVIGIQNLGISGLPDLINFLILTSGLSCGNAYLYASSRTLYGLARDGQAPRFLLKCTSAGVPIYCVGTVSLIACITFLTASNNAIEVFFWFVDLTTSGLIATYVMMIITFIGWYRAKRAQGFDDSKLYYLAPLNPWAAYFAVVLGSAALLFIGFTSFVPFDTQGFVTSYFCLPYSFTLFFVWKIFKRTKWVDPKTADLISGKAEADYECRKWEEGGIEANWKAELAGMSFWRRVWERIW